jgi:AraC-like DNA-binding protein
MSMVQARWEMVILVYLNELIASQPIVPYIRESNMAVRKPWQNPERRLLDYLLIYIQEGHCCFHIDGEALHFYAGEFCLIQPGSLNILEGLTDTVTPFAHLDFFYNKDREKSFPTRPGQIDLSAYLGLMQPKLNDIEGLYVPVRLKPRNPTVFRETYLLMIEYWQNPSPLFQLKTQQLATELILAILEDHYQDKESSKSKDSAHTLQWVPSFFSYHLREPLSIEDMAQRAHLSSSRFSALFKQQFGVAPHQYLLDLRVRHAQELLLNTDLSQEDIASYCGFADIHHFSKAFRKRTGQTPGNCRKEKPS